MGVNADFRADFSNFIAAINAAKLQLVDFGKGAETVEKHLNDMVDKFSGRELIQQASELTIAIHEVGGVSKLTANELANVGAKANEAVEKLKKLGYEVPAGLQQLADATKKADDATGGFSVSLTGLATSWAAGVASGEIFVQILNSVASAAWDVAKALPAIALKGAEFGSIEESFKTLTAAIGQTGDVLLNTMRQASHGTINDLTLMTVANKNLAAGVNFTTEQYGAMVGAALRLSNAEGIGVADALTKVNDNLLTGQTRGVARLVGSDALIGAEERFAQALNTTKDHLSPEQELWAKRIAIFDGMAATSTRLGDVTDGLGEHVQQVGTEWDNFTLELGKAIAQSPVLEAAFRGVMAALSNAFGGSQQDLITGVTHAIEDMAIIAVDGARGLVDLGASIAEQFNHARAMVLLAVEGMALASDPSRITEVVGNIKAIGEQWAKSGVEINTGAVRVIEGLDKTRNAMMTARHEADETFLANQKIADEQGRVAAAAAAAGAGIKQFSTDIGESKAEIAAGERATKLLREAIDNISSVGVDYSTTLNQMNQDTRALVEAQLAQGASIKDLGTIYTLTANQQRAFTEQQKVSAAATADVAKLWNEYTELVGNGAGTAYEKAQAAIDKWYDNEIAKHQAAGTDTAEFYDALAALDTAKYAKLESNRVADDTASRKHAEDKAKRDEEAYQFALAHADQFSADHIEKLRLDANASKLAADGWGLGWKDNAEKAGKAVDGLGDRIVSIGHAITPVNQMWDDASKSFIAVPSAMGAAWDAAKAKIDAAEDASNAVVRTLQLATVESNSFADSVQTWFPQFETGSAAARNFMSSGMTAGEAAYAASGGIISGSIGGGITHRASGGPVTAGTPYLVGEAGPELFVPSSSGGIVPNGGGGSVTININGSVLGTPNEIARVVGGAMMNLLRTQGTRLPVAGGMA